VQEKSTFFRKDAQRYSFFLIYANFWRQKSQKKKKADAKKEMPSTRRREDGAKKERTDIEKKEQA